MSTDPAETRRRVEIPVGVVFGRHLDPSYRWPPLALDPAVASRTAAGHLLAPPGFSGVGGSAERLSRRYWGVPTGIPSLRTEAATALSARKGWQQTRPGAAPEALRWVSNTRRPTLRVDASTSATTVEVALIELRTRGLGVVEQVATWYAAQPLTSGLGPTGTRFLATSLATLDDLDAVAEHPDGGTCRVVWTLTRAPRGSGPLPAPVTVEQLPLAAAGIGLPRSWADLRYAWGGRYTHHMRGVVGGTGNVSLRLFATAVVEGPGLFDLTFAGRLAGWTQQGGPLGTAALAATQR